MKSLVFLISLIFLTLAAQASPIEDIQVVGQTKTKAWALLRRLNINVGDDLTELELEDLKVRASQNPQYILKSLTFERGILKIEIEDKWSIVPVPLLTQSGDYYMRGLGLYENNFLGRLETLVPAVAWTNAGLNYLLLYNSENFFTPNIGISSLIVRINTLSHFYRQTEEKFHFETRENVFEFTPNYFYKNWVIKSGPIFFNKNVYAGNGMKEHFEGSGLRSRFHIKFYEQYEPLLRGYFFTFNNYILRPKEGNDTFFQGKIEFNATFPIQDQHFFNFSQNLGLASEKSFFYQFSEGAHEGFRGYDAESLQMQRYSATMLQYQHHLANRFYLISFFENTYSVLINPIGGSHLNENTIGGGLRYYLQKISLPGINFEYGYNIQDKTSHFHFNVGLQL